LAAMTTTSSWLPEPVAGATTLRERAYEAIKDGILRLELEPGAPLVEATLAAQLGVSKSPIRDALHRLEREGLAVRQPFKGVYVASLSRDDMLDAFEVRSVLEDHAVERAATGGMAPELLAQARDHIDSGRRAVEAGDAEAVDDSIDGFHRTILLGAGSPLLTHLLGSVYDRLARARAMAVHSGTRGRRSMAEHAQIIDAIERGDPAGAVAASHAHNERLLHEMTEMLDRHLPRIGDAP
jgi:DNA-binding GntR family transcriptional regulator